MLIAFGADIRVCHLSCLYGVEGFAGILQCDKDAIGVNMDMHIEGMVKDISLRMLRYVGHQLLAAQIYLEDVAGWYVAVFEECVNIRQCGADFLYIISYRTVEGWSASIAWYHGER